jgi:hypothetical protein
VHSPRRQAGFRKRPPWPPAPGDSQARQRVPCLLNAADGHQTVPRTVLPGNHPVKDLDGANRATQWGRLAGPSSPGAHACTAANGRCAVPRPRATCRSCRHGTGCPSGVRRSTPVRRSEPPASATPTGVHSAGVRGATRSIRTRLRPRIRPSPETGHFGWAAREEKDESGEHLRDQELAGERLVVSAGSTTSPQA